MDIKRWEITCRAGKATGELSKIFYRQNSQNVQDTVESHNPGLLESPKDNLCQILEKDRNIDSWHKELEAKNMCIVTLNWRLKKN